MSKLGKLRTSGGDLDALVRASSHTIMLRHIVHTLLCIAALVLGFSISREALLIVVSFRLPYGSLYVKTTTHAHGHEVAIISFPRMKQTRAISGSDFSVSRLTNDQTEMRVPHAKGLSSSTQEGNTRVHAFSESKVMLQEQVSLLHSPDLKATSRSSRVHVGRHQILIRPWPHPNPLEIVSAYNMMTLVQEEQQHAYGLKERKQLLVITCHETFQLTGLTGLMHTLRLIRGPLIWIVVEAGSLSNETAALLASSNLFFHHMGVEDARANVTARMRIEGLRYIREQHLEGIVLYADESITYNLDFFEEVQKVKWVGAFTASFSPFLGTQGDGSAACEDAQKLNTPISRLTEASGEGLNPFQNPCNASTNGVCWYSPMRNESTSSSWSAFVFNARLFWEDDTVLWARSWREYFAGNETLVQSPLDLVKDSSHIEALGRCGHVLV